MTRHWWEGVVEEVEGPRSIVVEAQAQTKNDAIKALKREARTLRPEMGGGDLRVDKLTISEQEPEIYN